MENLESKIETLLFLSTKPVSVTALAKALSATSSEVSAALLTLAERRNVDDLGIHLTHVDDTWQLVANPAYSALGDKLVKEESGELTRPSLEALTIIAYRGPITKPEIEAIRGVNCALILRNLLMRGLIEERDDHLKGQTVYTLSLDAIRYLGLHDVRELPGYNELSANAKIEKLLASLIAEEPEGSNL